MVVSPDAGGVERARAFAKRLNASLAIIDKRRDATAIKAMTLIGNVWGKEAIILDDMITTGATLTMASELLMRHGVRTVHACVTHPVMSRNAVSNLQGSMIQTLAVTDTIPLIPGSRGPGKDPGFERGAPPGGGHQTHPQSGFGEFLVCLKKLSASQQLASATANSICRLSFISCLVLSNRMVPTGLICRR